MPDQTALKQHMKDRVWIEQVWADHQECFSALTQSEQSIIHDYYKAHRSELTEDQLQLHWTEREADRPRAETALNILHQVYDWCLQEQGKDATYFAHVPMAPDAVHGSYQKQGGEKRVVVGAVLNPEPDVHLMVLALIDLAKQLQAEQNAAAAAPGTT